jgi:RNA polymerase-binding transcription factor DksA/CRP-like cAMP-binding protein
MLPRLFPTLTAAQIDRVVSHGRRRATAPGELLVDVGDRAVPLFVVVRGIVDVLEVSAERESVIVSHTPGSFSGEANLISGRPSVARLRVREAGEVVELSRDQLLALVQTDAELSEILMRAFVLRRLELIAREAGGVVVLGSTHSGATLRIREFLVRNGQPFHCDCLRASGARTTNGGCCRRTRRTQWPAAAGAGKEVMNIDGYRQRLLNLETRLSRKADEGRRDARSQALDSPGDVGDASVADEGQSESYTEAELDATVLQQVRDALRRIDEGSFGRCVVDGEPIEQKRLEAVPWTPYCLKHQQSIELEGRRPPSTL